MSNSNHQKKESEAKRLKEILSNLGIESTNIEHSEGPDFDLEIQGKEIGIELTEIDTHSKSHALRSIARIDTDISNQIKDRLTELKIPRIVLTYYYRKSFTSRLKKEQKANLIKFMVDFVIKHINEVSIDSDRYKEYDVDESDIIESIKISHSSNEEEIFVFRNKIHLSGSISKEKIIDIIRKKEPLMNFDRNKETWLFITISEDEWSDGSSIESLGNFSTKFQYIVASFWLTKKIVTLIDNRNHRIN